MTEKNKENISEIYSVNLWERNEANISDREGKDSSGKICGQSIPRIIIAAPKSGSGKTLITCALLEALNERKRDVISFKCGPDYIDPMFHRTVLGVPSENLDIFLAGEDGVRERLNKAAAGREIAVIEGVMGLYDGSGVKSDENSTYHLAKTTKTPIVLVVDAKGMGRSVCALIKGFVQYDTEGLICGVILNRAGRGVYEMLKDVVKEETGVPVIGYFPHNVQFSFESRHLGLKLPEEVEDIRKKIGMAAEELADSGAVDEVIRLAGNFSEQKVIPAEYSLHNSSDTALSDDTKTKKDSEDQKSRGKRQLTLAVARDEAFCFYYEANFDLFRKYGVQLRFFSPLHDAAVPAGADGLLLGGGYPELYAKQLSENMSMRQSIKEAIYAGIPSLAECGGFMYLHESMEVEGVSYPMVQAVEGKVFNTGKLVRFGYVEINEKNAVFLPPGKAIKGHEFHYFDSTDNGSACIASKPVSKKSWECVHAADDHFWGFAHLYYPSAPEFAEYFIRKMEEYSLRR